MGLAISVDTASWWDTHEGQQVIAAASEMEWTAATEMAASAALRRQYPHIPVEQLSSVIELVHAREQAVTKLGDHTRSWYLTSDTVQQATSWPVAHHRAVSLTNRLHDTHHGSLAVHDATCSIGGELAAFTPFFKVSGSDLDPGRVAMARHNLPHVDITGADALHPTWSGSTVTLLDPARRTGSGQRLYKGPHATTPTLTDVLHTYANRPYVVKCAPGVDWAELIADGWGTGPWKGEVEIVALKAPGNSGVKEAALFSPELAHPGVTRRATVLDSTGSILDSITDGPDYRQAAADVPVQEADAIIVEPNGAIVRAGLVREWAAVHNLWQLDARIAHLSGNQAPPGVPYFEVTTQVRFRVAELKKALRTLPTSSLEILVRGVDVDPTMLRRRILPKPTPGAPARTLVISRVDTHAVAFICSSQQVG